MSILVIGVNHRSGPLSVLERLTIPARRAAEGRRPSGPSRHRARGRADQHLQPHRGLRRRRALPRGLRRHPRLPLRDGDIAADDLHPHLYSHHDEAAVSHLFQVAAGLDSAVVGESEILGQVRQAWEVAQVEGAARTTMNLLFRQALVVGKRARTETGIGRGTTSVSQAAVEMASRTPRRSRRPSRRCRRCRRHG